MKKITVFTPTYNRAYTLESLYQSLVNQTSKNFLWLIVDDGSNDNTKELVESFKNEKKIDIKYIYQINKGKSQAHNLGVALCETDLFVCVDSDDFLLENAIEEILKLWSDIEDESKIIGIIAKCVAKDGHSITKMETKNIKNNCSTLKNAYSRKYLIGDTCLVYRTACLKQVEFPFFVGEKFVPESFLYDKLDQMGEMYLFDKNVYVFEYLEDGYTRNINKLIYNNPKGYIAYIKQRINLDTKYLEKFLDIIRYVSISFVNRNSLLLQDYKLLSLLAIPGGYYLYRKRFYAFKIRDNDNQYNNKDFK